MFLLLKYTLLYTVVLMMVALGGMFSERSGIINIALEGIMVIGGLMGVIATQLMPAGSSAFAIVAVSVLAAAIAGMVYAGLLAFASINLNADQTIGGTALNLLATALAMVIAKGVNHSASAKLDYSNRAFIYDFGPLTVNVFLFIGLVALILSYIVLYKTRLGLRLRACGEHPQAADSVGINVYKMRYIGVLISGVLGGIGGMAYIIPSVSSWNFEVGVSGCGLPRAGGHDFRPVEAVPHFPCGGILCAVQVVGEHCQLDSVLGRAGLDAEHVQHDSVHRVDDYSGVHEQEIPRAEGRGHSLRQGFAVKGEVLELLAPNPRQEPEVPALPTIKNSPMDFHRRIFLPTDSNSREAKKGV